jgi:pimeloyl-ACP methyl ester carboxylesterase
MMNPRRIFFVVLFFICCATGIFSQAPKSRWAKYDNGKVHYYDIGNHKAKNALILIHGWTCNADFWKDSYNAFPAYRVIAIDLPGHGQSDKPNANYSMEYFARSIDAVMTDAKVKKAVLVGHSMGTPVIRQFYLIFPDKTLGLVTVDGALKPFGPKAQMEAFFTPLFNDYRNQAPKFVDGLLEPTRADLKPSIRATMLAAPDYVAIGAMKGMLDDAIWIDDKINVPVLTIIADSPNWPKNIEDVYRATAPNLEFHRWTGVSHFLMMEKPKEFNEAVASFVTKNRLL